MNNNYKFVYKGGIYFSLILLFLVFVGFFKTYFGLIPHFEKTPVLIHWHFTFLMSWVLLLFVQPILVHYKKYKWHRRLGKITYLLAPLILASLISLMIRYYNKYHLEEYSLLDVIIIMHSQEVHAFQFLLFYVLALVYRRNPFLHGIYMVATGFIFINPSLTRALGIFNPTYPVAEAIVMCFTDLVILTMLFLAVKKGINYKPYIFIFLVFQLHDIPMFIKLWGDLF